MYKGKIIGSDEVIQGELIIEGLKYYIKQTFEFGTSTSAVDPESIEEVIEVIEDD